MVGLYVSSRAAQCKRSGAGRGACQPIVPSQRQPRLLLPCAARAAGGCKRRGGCLLEAPDHARCGARAPVDDQLNGAARAFVAGEINAVFELHLILASTEGPRLLGRRHQQDAMAVRQPRRLDCRMQMKAYGIAVLLGADLRAAVGVKEQILTFEFGAVGGERHCTLVHNAKTPGVAVMGCPDQRAVWQLLARYRDLAWSAEHR